MRKVALITGSSRGIGRAAAARLARDGYAVCINYIEREDKAEELVQELRGEGHDAIAVQADVADGAAVRAMAAACEKAFGPITLLVNNAGIAGQSVFQDISDEMWNRYFAVNIGGMRHTIQAVLKRTAASSTFLRSGEATALPAKPPMPRRSTPSSGSRVRLPWNLPLRASA